MNKKLKNKNLIQGKSRNQKATTKIPAKSFDAAFEKDNVIKHLNLNSVKFRNYKKED